MQEVTTRFPGRIDSGVTSYGSAGDLAGALRRAAAAHGQHEKRVAGDHSDWPEWYARALRSSSCRCPAFVY